jgi:hypothetical protein
MGTKQDEKPLDTKGTKADQCGSSAKTAEKANSNKECSKNEVAEEKKSDKKEAELSGPE